MTGKFKSFRVDKIDVGRGYGQDDTVGLGNVFGYEISGLLFDICRLIANGNLARRARVST